MEALTHLATFALGLGSGWALKVAIDNRKKVERNTTTVAQQNSNVVGGNLAGRDITTGERK